MGERCRTTIPRESGCTLRNRLERVEFPQGVLPAMALRRNSLPVESQPWSADWLDCPVALYFAGLIGPVIAVNVPYVDSLNNGSDWREVTIVRQADVPPLLQLMEAFSSSHSLKMMGGGSVNVPSLKWEDLLLDESVSRLVKDDFLMFLQREHWFKEHRLPFRRGYLLHGPPGNGKSSVIRAMLSTPGLSGFTINPFNQFFDEDMLASMFAEAAQSTLAVIVLEDLDRCYPAEQDPNKECTMPLQQLLNHLDGVASQDGLIVVATANNPTVLDPALLRRPGRFDRVVGFQNPSPGLREKYFRQMHDCLAEENLGDCVRRTQGFSFAQLRETYVLAGQTALEKDCVINGATLTQAAQSLKEMMRCTDSKWNAQAGFRDTCSPQYRIGNESVEVQSEGANV